MVLPEFTRFFEDRIRGGAQVIGVLRECVMFPEMLAVPGVRGFVPFPAHATEDIMRGADGESAYWPSVRQFEITGRRRRFTPFRELALHEVDERRVTFGQVCHF